jgi:EAL domain-containing protein (putative c-di-GMP-specific phosphodiesterase class I)
MENRRSTAVVSGIPGTLGVDYQGVTDTNGNIVSYEALVRAREPDLKPGQFLPRLRRRKEVHALTRAVITLVCRDIQETGNTFPIHVNIPFTHLNDAMFRDIMRILGQFQIPPSLFAVEILEKPNFVWTRKALRIANALKKQGIHVYMDDYGRHQWQRDAIALFQFDAIKIDRPLIRESLDLGATLRQLEECGINAFIIEGAENHSDLRIIDRAMQQLKTANVYVQGFVFTRPEKDALQH